MPPLTTIGPKGFLRLTADNSPADGPTHLGFRLSGTGEEIVLTDTTDKVIDSVLFGEQIRGISKGRYPDGASTIAFFPNSATPGQANLILGDSDEDGLPNFWENRYGLNPNDAGDATLDKDNDSHTNLEEFLAGTRPNDTDSILSLGLRMNEDSLTAVFEAQTGRTYVLWSTADVAGGEWIKVQEFLPQDSNRTIIHDLPVEHLPLPNGYYRLTIPATND